MQNYVTMCKGEVYGPNHKDYKQVFGGEFLNSLDKV